MLLHVIYWDGNVDFGWKCSEMRSEANFICD